MITKEVTVCGNTATLQIGGRVYSDRHGDCGPPSQTPRTLKVRGSYRGGKFLATLIHELMHLASWPISEDFITQAAEDIAEILLDPDIEERIHAEEIMRNKNKKYAADKSASKEIRKLPKRGNRKTASTLKPTKKKGK